MEKDNYPLYYYYFFYCVTLNDFIAVAPQILNYQDPMPKKKSTINIIQYIFHIKKIKKKK